MVMIRKLGEKLRKAKEAMLEYAYLVTLGAAVAVVAASAMYTEHVRTRFETQYSQPVEAAADAPEIAQTALFLAQNDYVTGQTIVVDGGMTI